MSVERRVGRAMYDFKDLLLQRISNTIEENVHRNNIELSDDQKKELLANVGNDIESLFNNATDRVIREANRN